jgi:hypothetical protein
MQFTVYTVHLQSWEAVSNKNNQRLYIASSPPPFSFVKINFHAATTEMIYAWTDTLVSCDTGKIISHGSV